MIQFDGFPALPPVRSMLQYSSSQAPSAKGFLTSLGLVAYTAPLLWLTSGSQSLMGSDEGYYAQMAREMVSSGHWLAPSFLGVPWFEKPPLNQWLIALSFSTFGIGEASARLPSALAALLGVLLTYWIGRVLVGERRALYAALVLPTCYLWIFYGRLAVSDVILTVLELVGLGCLLASVQTRRQWPALGWGIALGFGVLLKSGMVLLAAAAVLPWLVLARREHRLLTNPYLHAGVVLGTGLCGLWYWSATQVYGDEVYNGLFGMLAVLSKKDFHAVGPFYYFWNLPANTFPWTLAAVCGGWVVARERRSLLLLLGYPLVLLALLQAFATKTPYYLVQVCPFIALLAGVWIDLCLQSRFGNRALQATSGFVGGVGLLLIAAAAVLYLRADLIAGSGVYLPAALGLGFAWLAVAGLFLVRRLVPWRRLWATCLIGGPWCGLALGALTTPLGNYSPQFKAYREEFAAHTELQRPIALVYENNGRRVSEFIALAFYTPIPARSLDAAQVMAGSESLWWLAPESRAALDTAKFAYEPLAEVSGWTLARRKSSG